MVLPLATRGEMVLSGEMVDFDDEIGFFLVFYM